MPIDNMIVTARRQGRSYLVEVTCSTVERLKGKPRWVPSKMRNRVDRGGMVPGHPEPVVRVVYAPRQSLRVEPRRAPSPSEILAMIADVLANDDAALSGEVIDVALLPMDPLW